MHNSRFRYLALIFAALLVLSACASEEPSSASVAVEAPADGGTTPSPVIVEMTSTDFTIAPAGTIEEGTGHFHLMINVPCVAPGQVIPADDNHFHYGDGSTTAELDLAPGEYTLCLQAGDGIHTALDLTDTVSFTVTD